MSGELEISTYGQVVVESILKVSNHEDSKAWVVDLKSKYPELALCSVGREEQVILLKTSRTLYADDSKDTQTVLSFTPPDDGRWQMLVDGGRYSVYVSVFRYPNDEEDN